MTYIVAMLKLNELIYHSQGDTEANHADADKVLCDLLIELGYADVVLLYNRIDKWYA